jgi:hypothetical protein
MRPVDPAGVLDRRTVRADGATGSGGARGGGAVERAPSPPAHPRPQPALIDEISLRRRALLAEVTRLASGVGAAIREARAVNLPTVSGISEAREALVAWAHLLEELLTPPAGPDA